MQSTNTRNEIKQLAQTMETLAHEVQVRLDAGSDILTLANELVRNSSTFVFTLGELYALEQVGTTKTRTARKVTSGSTASSRNYHNVRDNLGRFTSKV